MITETEGGHGRYINNLPRYGLVIVFIWFGVDKFVLHEFYVNWLAATERVKVLLPVTDLSLSIYAIGISELVLGVLLLSGFKIRLVAIFVCIWLVLIMFTAQYPSSLPQDLGVFGMAIFLVLTNGTWKNAYTEKFLKYAKILRYSISAVFFLWAADYLLNYERHIGWMQFFSYVGRDLPTSNILYFIISTAAVEIILGIMLSVKKKNIITYASIATTIFLIYAMIVLDPPVNNHQSVGLALSTAWLAYLGFKVKNNVTTHM